MVSAQVNVSAMPAFPPCMIQPTDGLEEGEKVYWHYQPRKGKPAQRIPAVIDKIMSTRARIEFSVWVADEWVLHRRTIGFNSLTRRSELHPGIDQPVQTLNSAY